ncbi:hypothetical protein CJF32_00008451 [Rutstroemia sp. NJR-2017a WRK4]|nr:hypothetical protein CJF32_00008451 [Rutstroemia sp. NJR-2017a WRK4]
MSEPVQENTGVEVDPELEEEDTELENQNAKTTSTMTKIENYLGQEHQFRVGKDTWKVSGRPLHDTNYEYFTKAVYNCRLVNGRESNAIVKIWIEWDRVGPWDRELMALNIMEDNYEKLRRTKSDIVKTIPYKPFPTPIGSAHIRQDQRTNAFLPVYDGHLAYLVMEKLPGRRIEPDEFWARDHYWDSKWDKPRRLKFRKAMGKAAGVINALHIENLDRAMRNLLWDEQRERCYFIDWESWEELEDAIELKAFQFQYNMYYRHNNGELIE